MTTKKQNFREREERQRKSIKMKTWKDHREEY